MAPPPGPGGFFSAGFWTPAFTGFITFIAVTWWANVNSDGGGKVIQKQNSCINEQPRAAGHALVQPDEPRLPHLAVGADARWSRWSCIPPLTTTRWPTRA